MTVTVVCWNSNDFLFQPSEAPVYPGTKCKTKPCDVVNKACHPFCRLNFVHEVKHTGMYVTSSPFNSIWLHSRYVLQLYYELYVVLLFVNLYVVRNLELMIGCVLCRCSDTVPVHGLHWEDNEPGNDGTVQAPAYSRRKAHQDGCQVGPISISYGPVSTRESHEARRQPKQLLRRTHHRHSASPTQTRKETMGLEWYG